MQKSEEFANSCWADTRPWHPLHLVYRDILPSLDDLAARMPPNGLLVGSADGAIGRYIALLPGSHFWISPESLLGGNLDERSDAGLVFDLCILDLSRADLSHARQLHEAATRRLRKGGKLWICWINFAGESGAELERDLVRCLALPGQYLRMSLISQARRGWRSVSRVGRRLWQGYAIGHCGTGRCSPLPAAHFLRA